MMLTGERAQARGTAILSSLDAEQRACVLALPGPALLRAPAGTGKSRVLAHRVAYVCAALGVPPRRFLVWVGTDHGAELLRMRIERLLGFAFHGAWLGTVNAVCQRILRAHASAIGRRATFRILPAAHTRTLIRRIVRDLGVDADRWSPARLSEAIAAAKNARLVPDGVVGEVFRAYEQALAAENAVDQEDVLTMVLRLLDEKGTLRDRYRRRFAHVVVDDFQDLGAPQRELLALLGAPGGNVLAAADDDLGLGLAGPGPSINPFDAAFPGARHLSLSRNYRSSGRILRAASRLIRHNPDGLRGDIEAQRRRGHKVVAIQTGDELEEADLVIKWAKRWARRSETRLESTAVMFRNAIQARPFEEALVRAGLPYRVLGGVRFHERREVRDVLCFLRLCLGGGDVRALRLIANVPRRGIGPASVRTIARLQRAAPVSLAEAAMRAAQLPRVTAQRAGALADLGRLLSDLEEQAKLLSVADLIDELVKRSGYDAMLAELPAADEETRREGIDELRGLARSYSGTAVQALPAFFERVARAGALPWKSEKAHEIPATVRAEERGVELLTMEAARGLEYDVVFITGLEEGLFPRSRAKLGGDGEIQAERRLCYLGMTRARNRLVLTHALTRTLFGKPVGGVRSRFLKESGRNVRHFRLGGARLGAAPKVAVAEAAPVESEAPTLMHVSEGQRVVHPLYGEGTVLRVEESGPHGHVAVRFAPAIGDKRLILSLARLHPVG